MTGSLKRRGFLAQTMAAAAAMVTLPVVGRGGGAHAGTTRTHHVEITRFKFIPDRLVVRPGDKIIWTNRDIAPHTATGDDESWDTGKIGKDESQAVTVTAGMQASYFCRYHPNMKAGLVVERD